ncbi:hypothetical protein RRF57_001505 [Xylaria bambusicola]|uniref:Uncharacterized protein n=1 Tax=Xylaria bambusicola TaxID=326684 RepID=A0AAN7UQW3_9PEZI
MALAPIISQQRVAELNNYFATEYGFSPEKQIQGNIIYRRVDQQNVLERVVVKFPLNDYLQDGIGIEAGALFQQWGSEHNVRILSIPRKPQYVRWREPINRYLSNPPPTLPWWLQVNPQVYDNDLDFPFLVVEYLPRGTGCVRFRVVTSYHMI